MSDDITHNKHGGNPYSNAAHLRTNKTRDMQRLYRLIFERHPDGLTAEEASFATGMLYSTCSARFSDMKKVDWIEHCGTRLSSSGNTSGVWRVIKDDAA